MDDFAEIGTGLNVPPMNESPDGETVHPEQAMAFRVSLSGEDARLLWGEYREKCNGPSDLKAVAEGLYKAREKIGAQMEAAAENGDEITEFAREKFRQAMFEAPLVEVMYERAVFNRGKIPQWDSVRWQDRIGVCLNGNNASHDALRVLYFLLVQRDRDFDGVSDLHRTAGEAFGKGRSAVANALRRGRNNDTTRQLKEWNELPDSVDGYREWLEKHPELAVDV